MIDIPAPDGEPPPIEPPLPKPTPSPPGVSDEALHWAEEAEREQDA